LLLVYGTTAEVRNAGSSVFSEESRETSRALESVDENTKFQPRDKSITPTRERPGTASRIRSATVVQHPSNLQITTNAPPPFMNGALRSATMTSATPRSGESFASSASSKAGGDFTEEDRIFEKIFLRLQQSSEMALKTLPSVSSNFFTAMKINSQQSNPDQPKQFWQVLIQKCSISLQNAEALKARLSTIKLKEPGIRTQGAFWELCNAFIHVI